MKKTGSRDGSRNSLKFGITFKVGITTWRVGLGFLFFSLPALGGTPALDEVRNRCLRGELEWLSEGETYRVTVPENPDLTVEARLDRRGDLHLDFRTRIPGGGQNSRVSALRGKEQFEAILDHYTGRVRRIIGYWMAEGDNLETFNRLTAPPDGLPPQEAALLTWTGQQASRAGYSQVRIEELTGAPGRYIIVQIAFER
jgi:hypothetical protein